MVDSDLEPFFALLTLTAEQYRREISVHLRKLYWNALSGYDLQTVRDALHMHIHNPDKGRFWPSVADIIYAIEGGGQDRALRAWALVDRAVRLVGSYESVVFDDPLIHCAIDEMGGWTSLGKKQEKEWPFVAKEFAERYRNLAAHRRPGDTHPPVLVGTIEADRAGHGNRGAAPVRPRLIGDPHKAAEVVRTGRRPSGNGWPALPLGDCLALEQREPSFPKRAALPPVSYPVGASRGGDPLAAVRSVLAAHGRTDTISLPDAESAPGSSTQSNSTRSTHEHDTPTAREILRTDVTENPDPHKGGR